MCMIPVYAHNLWRCSGPGKVTLMCVLLLCNKRTEIASSWDNSYIDVVYYIHGCTTEVHLWECRYQSVCVDQVVCAIRCHCWT